MSSKSIRLAVEGCGHGTLVSIYQAVQEQCAQKGWDGVDCVIIGGDFQAVRNASDLKAMSVPAKYREIGDFHRFYSGELTAPYLTIFAAGNHEASNHLWELYYGGWVAPNIYYLGAANVVRLGPLRIASMSGIWKGYDYRKPHYERLPYNRANVGSMYHIREVDVRKLLQIQSQVDICLSHDWPQGIEWRGDYKYLFRKKDLFEADARSGRLGNVAAAQVMNWLRPRWWFSAHLHIKYTASVYWKPEGEQDALLQKKAALMQMLDIEDDEEDSNGNAHNGASNADEIALEEDAPSTLNADEIDLDMDGEVGGVTVAAVKNTDEIDLDLDDEDGDSAPAKPAAAPVADQEKEKKVTEKEALRSQLPDSFKQPPQQEQRQRQSRGPQSQPDFQITEAIAPGVTNDVTHFLALDKCLPRRQFLELMEVEPLPGSQSKGGEEQEGYQRPFTFEYDPEWLAITKAMAGELILAPPNATVDQNALKTPPSESLEDYQTSISTAKAWITENIKDFTIPQNFTLTAPVYDGVDIHSKEIEDPREYNNPQTGKFCEMLGIENRFFASEEEWQVRVTLGPQPDEERFQHHGGGRGGRGGGGRGGFNRGRGQRGRGWRGGRGR